MAIKQHKRKILALDSVFTYKPHTVLSLTALEQASGFLDFAKLANDPDMIEATRAVQNYLIDHQLPSCYPSRSCLVP